MLHFVSIDATTFSLQPVCHHTLQEGEEEGEDLWSSDPEDYILPDMPPEVEAQFEEALARLGGAPARGAVAGALQRTCLCRRAARCSLAW